jgi:hypothetical protein
MRKLLVTSALGLVLAACSSDSGESQDPSQPFYTGGPPAGEPGTPGTGGDGGGAGATPVDPPFTAVNYPPPPYGTQIASTMENFKFKGWHKPGEMGWNPDTFEDVSIADFYDPNGEKGIKYIMLNASAVWCTVCRAEYKEFNAKGTYATYNAQGVEFIGAIFEDGSNPPKPAKPEDLEWWGSTYNVQFPMILDPGFKLGQFFTADATPMNLIIDARTMKVVGKVLGGNTEVLFGQLDALLAGG